MKNKKIFFFIGTTAELIKLCPVVKELKHRNIKFKIISSGQNQLHFDDLKGYIGPIKADVQMGEKINKSSGFFFLYWALKTFLFGLFYFRREFKGLNKSNSYFIVHGDTVSALIGSFLAKIYNLKLVHVESGLYSFNYLEPFPEEICRNIIDRIADVLFPPNEWAKDHVKNFPGEKVVTGENTLIESFLWAAKTKPSDEIIENIKSFKRYYILIMHRQEHVMFRKNWSKNTLDYIIRNADDNLNCVLLNHPLTVEIVESLRLKSHNKIKDRIKLIPRIPYSDFMKLLKSAEFIATDGCTNQLESYFLGLPCLALRDMTEQMEGLDKNVVLCRSDKKIMRNFLANYKNYSAKTIRDKRRPSKIIVDYLMPKS